MGTAHMEELFGLEGKVVAGIWSAKLKSMADPWLSTLPGEGGAP